MSNLPRNGSACVCNPSTRRRRPSSKAVAAVSRKRIKGIIVLTDHLFYQERKKLVGLGADEVIQ